MPSSSIALIFARLIAWKPPESVSIAPSKPMKRATPPISCDQFGAGAQREMVGVGEHQAIAHTPQLSGAIALTAARVPTGMKAGVAISPCGRDQAAHARAAPSRRTSSIEV